MLQPDVQVLEPKEPVLLDELPPQELLVLQLAS
jgi:hypothetical protein